MILSVLSSLLAFLDSSLCITIKFFSRVCLEWQLWKRVSEQTPPVFRWVMTVTPCSPRGFPHWRSVSLIRIWIGMFFPRFSQNSCHLTWDWECDSEFEGKLHAILSIVQRQLGWLAGELSWGRHWGGSLRPFEGFELTGFAMEIDLETLQQLIFVLGRFTFVTINGRI